MSGALRVVSDDLGQAGPRRVLLVCPPFQRPHLSSLSTAHLATFLRERGADCREAYPHFDLFAIIGADRYMEVGDGTSLTGELLFAEGLHGEPADPDARAQLDAAFGSVVQRQAIRDEFEARCFARLDLDQTEVVGLTTSFHQLLAALFIARGIRTRSPSTTIVLGGAACTTPMGEAIGEAYPEVDVVVSGWGERPLLALTHETAATGLVESSDPIDLEAMPIPDFRALLAAAESHEPSLPLSLTFESSRGCWWGQKHHCRFCGVNGAGMPFHRKSSGRVVREISTLWHKHQKNLMATDAIMAREHLKEVMPEVARLEPPPRIFYEMKTNMTEDEVVAIARANVQGQPGVESLSSHLLHLMDKGVSGIANVALLKWCVERGVPIAWNLLYGIPGERDEDYDQQIALSNHIPHFPPPERINPIHLARYSPYYDEAARHGWTNVRPRPEYQSLHPHLPPDRLTQVANYFVGDGAVSPGTYIDRLSLAVTTWQQRNRRGEGLFLDPVQGLVRNGAERGFRFQMNPILERILERTHRIASVSAVLDHARCPEAVLGQLEAHGILYREGNRVVNLAVRTGLAARAG